MSTPPDAGPVVVIVTVDGAPDALDRIVEHARAGLDTHFPRYEGFLGGALHRATDGARLVQYLRWASQGQYVACRDDPLWDDVPTTRLFAAAVVAGEITVDERIHRIVTSRPADR